ncbi:MAG: protein kinase [Thermoanaerobaculia bacterium]|nr:protein kinase [Thermoanaerobaculia bacterium]
MLRQRRNEVVLVSIAVLVVVVPLAIQGWELYRFSQERIGITLSTDEENLFEVTNVLPGGPAEQAGLRAGDRLRGVQGTPLEELEDLEDLDAAIDASGGEEPLSLTVDREGDTITLSMRPGMPFPYFDFTVTTLTALTYLLIGPFALFKRPGYLRAQLLFLFTTSVALEIALPGVLTAIWLWLAATTLLTGFHMGVELHLASVIPEHQGWLERFPWVVPGYYVAGMGWGGLLAILLVAYHFEIELLPWEIFSIYEQTTGVIFPVWAAAVLVLLGRQALVYPEQKGRQQALIVFLGVLPWAIFAVAYQLGLAEQIPAHWDDLAWNLALLPFPLAVFLLLLRDTADQERILLDLIDEVQEVDSVGEISRIVSDRLYEAFHPKSTGVFYRRRHSRELTLGHSTGIHLEEEIIPEDSPLLRLLEAYGKAASYPEDLTGVPPEEGRWLEDLGAELLVPLTGRDERLLGLMVLGQKKSEEPYTPRDRRLLQALTAQIALVYENARLKDRVHQSQRIQREVMTRLGEEEINLVKECPECGRCFDADQSRCAEDGSELLPSQPVERAIGGRYHLERRIDRGGMGAIYEATDRHLSREVAVKVLMGTLATEEVSKRFETEARLTARLHHPNIVTVHDYGTTTTGAAYLVMELLVGSTMAALAEEGPIPASRAAEWYSQACSALDTAHREGIIHRDLKPGNLFLAEQPDGPAILKILDFGVAKVRKAVLDESGDLTTPGSLIGTFRYMAPEQLAGRGVDPRSDLFALAVVVAETVSGDHPFPESSPARVLKKIREVGYRPSFAGPAGAELDRVLSRALAADPAERYPTVTELERELIPALRNLSSGPESG